MRPRISLIYMRLCPSGWSVNLAGRCLVIILDGFVRAEQCFFFLLLLLILFIHPLPRHLPDSRLPGRIVVQICITARDWCCLTLLQCYIVWQKQVCANKDASEGMYLRYCENWELRTKKNQGTLELLLFIHSFIHSFGRIVRTELVPWLMIRNS